MATLTSREAATETGIPLATVQRLARLHSIGRRFGRSLAFERADLARLKSAYRGAAGNPLMGADQPAHYGRAKKNQKK